MNLTPLLHRYSNYLQMYALPDLSKPIYQANGVSFIPATISPDYATRRSTVAETLTEVLLANLGDSTSKSPYLIVSAVNKTSYYEITNYGSSERQIMTLQYMNRFESHPKLHVRYRNLCTFKRFITLT